MDDAPVTSGLLSRILDNPIRLRRRGLGALLIFAALSGVGWALRETFAGGMLTAVVWICAPLIAIAIGFGDAFLLQHGRGRRRVALTAILSVFVIPGVCVVVSTVTEGSQILVTTISMMALYAAVGAGLSAVLALGIARGGGYVARRITEMSEEDW